MCCKSGDSEKNKTRISVISGVLFISLILLIIIAIISAMIFESESLLFLILMPALPIGSISVVLAIISTYNFIKDKKNNLELSKTRLIFTVINIIELVFAFNTYILQPIIYSLKYSML